MRIYRRRADTTPYRAGSGQEAPPDRIAGVPSRCPARHHATPSAAIRMVQQGHQAGAHAQPHAGNQPRTSCTDYTHAKRSSAVVLGASRLSIETTLSGPGGRAGSLRPPGRSTRALFRVFAGLVVAGRARREAPSEPAGRALEHRAHDHQRCVSPYRSRSPRSARWRLPAPDLRN